VATSLLLQQQQTRDCAAPLGADTPYIQATWGGDSNPHDMQGLLTPQIRGAEHPLHAIWEARFGAHTPHTACGGF